MKIWFPIKIYAKMFSVMLYMSQKYNKTNQIFIRL